MDIYIYIPIAKRRNIFLLQEQVANMLVKGCNDKLGCSYHLTVYYIGYIERIPDS